MCFLPDRHGCDCGRVDWCDAARLRGLSSELCTLGLIEPGDSDGFPSRSVNGCGNLGLGARLEVNIGV